MTSSRPSLDLLRTLTEEHILRALLDRGRLTRAEIATHTGISKPTISQGVQRLAEAGLIHDTGERSAGRGRVGSYYALSGDWGAALVVAIRPDGVVAEARDPYGELVADARVELTRDAGADRAAAALAEAVRQLRSRTAGPLRTATISAADPVDRADGRLVRLPDSPFLIGEVDPPAVLSGLVDGPVIVDNDVNWAAAAERALGGAGDDFVYLHLGEGLGCAVVSDGEVRRGHAGMAGEIAHLISTGPDGRAVLLIEIFAELGLRRPGSTAIDTDRLLSAVDAPDGDRVARALARAVSGVVSATVALTDPEIAVVGGSWGGSETFLDRLQQEVAGSPRPVRIATAQAVEDPDLSGARITALARLRDQIITRSPT